ncbi:MAG: hypothetical protein A3G87_08100 [Omnitrophica bacterium RIFCSPLOWO2_12_FULL_50_11]|nr:MAG: hypothetical protein A3G87_08100 [Omnitrophica bacterium RIFCSPLOWO2_12_FULL_50_11]
MRKRLRKIRRAGTRSSTRSERAISVGVELETYSISVPEYRISRELHFPRRGIAELGERFTKDASIGSEYNSRVFYTVREAFFLLKNGLRKYIHYRSSPEEHDYRTLFPIGGWTDRFAGSHIHMALGKKKFEYRRARLLARRLHSHIPFLIALCGNSPVWRDRITAINSNRLLRGTEKYCKVTRRELLYKHHYRELTYNEGGKRKPPTLEIRVLDSGIPEYVVAAICVVKAVALQWLERKPSLNHLTHEDYLSARDQAIRYGPKAKLLWNRHALTVPQYVDLFFRKYEDELDQLAIPDDVIDVFKYLKRGWNQSTVIRRAAQKSRWHHRPTWERRFAKRYAAAIRALLDGNSYTEFAKALGVRLPSIERTWMGRRESKW